MSESKFKWDATGIWFFGVTTVAQQSDPCAVCGAEACDNPLSHHGSCFTAHGSKWRLCKVCWSGRNGDTLQLRDAIYERHVKPKEAQSVIGIDPASDAETEFKVECHKFNDEHARKLTDALPANLAARQRNIAALASEYAKSDASAGLLHPREWWSNRLRGGRRTR